MIKYILGFLMLTTSIFSQIEIDSSRASFDGVNTYTLYGYASFQANPRYDDTKYLAGFLFGTGREPVTFHPAGSVTWVNNRKQLQWTTTITNAPDGRYFYQAFVSPKTNPVGFTIPGDGSNNYDAPFIISDLPRNTRVLEGRVATFHIDAEGTNLNYEWFVDVARLDSNLVVVFDSLGNPIDSTYIHKYIYDFGFVIIQGETSNIYNTTAVMAINRNRYRARVYNLLGEASSRISTLKVR